MYALYIMNKLYIIFFLQRICSCIYKIQKRERKRERDATYSACIFKKSLFYVLQFKDPCNV